MKLLERRLSKFRTKNKDLTEEVLELDQEIEVKKALKPTKKLENACPKCGRELKIEPMGHAYLHVCTNEKCEYTKVVPFKKKK